MNWLPLILTARRRYSFPVTDAAVLQGVYKTYIRALPGVLKQ